MKKLKGGSISFQSLDQLRKFLTPKRLELLRVIRHRKPGSIYELAKILHRDIKNVLQDLTYLQELDLVDVTETRNKKVPHVRYDKIAFEVAI